VALQKALFGETNFMLFAPGEYSVTPEDASAQLEVAAMTQHPIALLIEKADKAINEEDFDTVVALYCEDAVLVIKPGTNAVGKIEIRRAMEAIAAHFDRSLEVRQAGMVILETADTALVLAKTVVSAKNQPAVERKATYVFRKDLHDRWLCAIDNSYGHEVLGADA